MTETTRRTVRAAFAACMLLVSGIARTQAADYERVVIDNDFPGGYQVEVADVNGDGKPDIIGVGGGTCAWYENPSWTKRMVTTPRDSPSIISSATADLDGDGKAEIAIASDFEMNTPKRGKLLLAVQGKTVDDPWTVVKVADVPSIHRLRWARPAGALSRGADGTRKTLPPELVVAPIFGPSAQPPRFDQAPARIVIFSVDRQPRTPAPVPGQPITKVAPPGPRLTRERSYNIGEAPVTHAIDATDVDGDGFDDLFSASNLGVTRYILVAVAGVPHFMPEVLTPGAPGNAPKKGSSEVHVGTLRDGRGFLATVEPWHGTDVAVYLVKSWKRDVKVGPDAVDVSSTTVGLRTVIDTSLKEGHALWVADVDGDGDDEIFAGFRGPGTSVLVFDHNARTDAWDRAVVDDAIAAQDLRGGDLDGDGRPDVVAIGGSTHNVVWYRHRKPR